MHKDFVSDVRTAFMSQASRDHAVRQEAYMRNQFPFFGLTKAQRTALQKSVFKKYPLHTEQQLCDVLRALWQQPERECKYTAIDLGIMYKKLWTSHFFACIEGLVITDSWWDTVDHLASNYMGTLLERYPELQDRMLQWINDDYMWKRRVALLYQLKYKKNTNLSILAQFCKLRMHEREFFIAKAIGWILREYSKTDPLWVRAFIEEHKTMLQPLSVREGSKYC